MKYFISLVVVVLLVGCGSTKNSNCNCPKHNWLKKEQVSDQRRV